MRNCIFIQQYAVKKKIGVGEMAIKDKKRDRNFVTAGYVVMRFTGSEIYNNTNIAHEIFQRIKTIMLNKRNRR